MEEKSIGEGGAGGGKRGGKENQESETKLEHRQSGVKENRRRKNGALAKLEKQKQSGGKEN